MAGLPTPSEKGIIPNAFDHIFGYIDDTHNDQKKFLVRCSFIEIYQEDIRDLLGKEPNKRLDLKEHPQKGVFVNGLSNNTVKSIPEIEELMAQGNKLRMVGQTAMNDTSSRSHSIFTIYIETAEMVSTLALLNMGLIQISAFFHRFKGSNDSRLESSTWSIWQVPSVRARPRLKVCDLKKLLKSIFRSLLLVTSSKHLSVEVSMCLSVTLS